MYQCTRYVVGFVGDNVALEAMLVFFQLFPASIETLFRYLRFLFLNDFCAIARTVGVKLLRWGQTILPEEIKRLCRGL